MVAAASARAVVASRRFVRYFERRSSAFATPRLQLARRRHYARADERHFSAMPRRCSHHNMRGRLPRGHMLYTPWVARHDS